MNRELMTELEGYSNEIDALKLVDRANYIGVGERRENSAEHSWHLAQLAMIFAPHVEGVDPFRAQKMALIHDVVEIDAGDVPVFLAGESDEIYAKELAAAERLFGLLPEAQGKELLDLWLEFESKSSKTARFVKLLDRVSPMLQQIKTAGKAWQEHKVGFEQALALYSEYRDEFPEIFDFVESKLQYAAEKGWLDSEK